MADTSNSLALLRVLIAAAWADSRLSQTEMNTIKDLARRFRLDDDDWFALQPWLEDPPRPEEVETLLEDLLSRIGTDSQRRAIAGHIEAVIQADDLISDEETAFLRRFEEVFSRPSSLGLFLGRVKRVVGSVPEPSRVDLDEFLRNKILFKLRRRTGDANINPEMHRLALLGGLMGIVAQADGEIDERELETIRQTLEARGEFDEDVLNLLVEIIREESVRGLDRYRLVTEYSDGASIGDRRELLDLLFEVAAADGGITHAELEELRAISSALHLSHKQYIGAKVRALED